jgi:hypothetical protein
MKNTTTIASREVETATSLAHRQRTTGRFLRGPIPLVDLGARRYLRRIASAIVLAGDMPPRSYLFIQWIVQRTSVSRFR